MALIYNNIRYAFDATKPLELMDIHKFIDTFQYPIDKLYIDKFWNGIRRIEWVVVDYALLRWMGYENARDIDNKQKYLDLLRGNFNQGDHYDTISACDTRICDLNVTKKVAKNTIIVRVKVFKKTLMMLRTSKADGVRDYFIMGDELFIDYVEYTQAVKDHNSGLTIKALEQQVAEMQLTFDVDTKPVARNEYVYILTNKRNYARHMFKIGKSVNPKSRLISYNTGIPIKDEDMFYIAEIATCDCTSLEKMIHKLLDNYHYRKEWFHIPHRDLKAIVDMVSGDVSRWSDSIDIFIQRGFENVESIPLEQFHNQPPLDQQIAKQIDKSYPRLKHEPGAITKFNDIRAVYSDMTTKKLLMINEAFTSRRIHMCLLCNQRHHKNCCEASTSGNRIKKTIIDNLQITD